MEAEGVITGSYTRGIFFNDNHQIQHATINLLKWQGKYSCKTPHDDKNKQTYKVM